MKVIIGFFSGVIVCGLLLLGLVSAVPILAQTDNTTSDNFSLVDLLPDIEMIYREALTSPLREARKNIYDEDIAEYYDRLLERTGLDSTDNVTQ